MANIQGWLAGLRGSVQTPGLGQGFQNVGQSLQNLGGQGAPTDFMPPSVPGPEGLMQENQPEDAGLRQPVMLAQAAKAPVRSTYDAQTGVTTNVFSGQAPAPQSKTVDQRRIENQKAADFQQQKLNEVTDPGMRARMGLTPLKR